MNVVWQELHLATGVSLKELPDDPGPQCLACQRRGRKCDSTPISCARCKENSIECPGYTNAFKKNGIRSSANRRTGQRTLKSSSSPSTNLQLVPSIPQETKDWTVLMDSIKYYNSNIVPYNKPAHLPFQRQNVFTKYWDFMPEILRHLWIVNVNAMKANRGAIDPYSSSELIQYRGRSLSGLHTLMKDVQGAVTDPYGVALYAILFIMGADMQLPESKWTTHLEAARKIIGLRGGLKSCFATFSHPTYGPLVSWMMADTVTATTCPSHLLGPAFVQTQLEVLEVIPDLEQDLIASAYCYPLPLLLALVKTNVLRAQTQNLPKNGRKAESLDLDVTAVLRSIETFDAGKWASRVSSFGRAQPETAEKSISVASVICLTSLAQCYKSAVLLYLLYSCMPTPLVSDLALKQQAHSAKYSLSQHLRILFSQGQNGIGVACDGPLHTQLWKYVSWPLLVRIYVETAWGAPPTIGVFDTTQSQDALDQTSDIRRDVEHLQAASAALGMRKLSNIESFVRRLQDDKLKAWKEGGVPLWSWDDALHERSLFVI